MANDPQAQPGSVPDAAAPRPAQPAQTAQAAPQDTAPPAAPLELTKAGWLERSRMFGAGPHAVAGALHDRAADERISEDDVRAALDEFSVTEGVSQ